MGQRLSFTPSSEDAHAAPDRSVGVFREVPAGVPLTKSLDLRKRARVISTGSHLPDGDGFWVYPYA